MKIPLLIAGAAVLALGACQKPADQSTAETPAAADRGTDSVATTPADSAPRAAADASTAPTAPASDASSSTPMNPDGTPMTPPPTLPTDPGTPSPGTPPAQ